MDAAISKRIRTGGLLLVAAGLALLAGCKPKALEPTYEQMAADRKLNKAVMAQCRDHPASYHQDTCIAAAKANSKWFMGDGKTKYTPVPITGFDKKPD